VDSQSSHVDTGRNTSDTELTEATGQVESSDIQEFLVTSEIVACKSVPWGSNYSFAVALERDQDQRLAIYKPQRGEVPLWDFPEGTLYRRERAAYLVSQALGWSFIPPTVIRDGPHGVGSVQLYVEPLKGDHLGKERDRFLDDLRRMAVFDIATNNADRKSGHCFVGIDQRLWGIDHGLTFNVVPKMRTIIWEFCGEPLPEPLLGDLRNLAEGQARDALQAQLRELLDAREVQAFFSRIERLIRSGVFPRLDPQRNLPRGFW
jgi:uncharacterized repeat protein (TIGR03843 family)